MSLKYEPSASACDRQGAGQEFMRVSSLSLSLSLSRSLALSLFLSLSLSLSIYIYIFIYIYIYIYICISRWRSLLTRARECPSRTRYRPRTEPASSCQESCVPKPLALTTRQGAEEPRRGPVERRARILQDGGGGRRHSVAPPRQGAQDARPQRLVGRTGCAGACLSRLRTRHTLEPLAWHWSHWPGR